MQYLWQCLPLTYWMSHESTTWEKYQCLLRLLCQWQYANIQTPIKNVYSNETLTKQKKKQKKYESKLVICIPWAGKSQIIEENDLFTKSITLIKFWHFYIHLKMEMITIWWRNSEYLSSLWFCYTRHSNSHPIWNSVPKEEIKGKHILIKSWH